MAAVASNHMSDSFRGSNSEQFPDSGPSFTAVNGTSSPTPISKSKSSQEIQKDASIETNGRSARANNQQERPKSPHHSRPSQTTGQADQGSSMQNSSTDRSAPNSASAISSATIQRQDKEPAEDAKAHYVSSHSRTPSSQQSKTETISPTKRKRSYSDNYDNANNNPAYHSHGLPSSPERSRMYELDNGRPREHGNLSPPTYPPPPDHSQPPELYPRPERHQLVRNEYEQRVDPNIAPAPNRPYYSDARMAEALQRENRNYESMTAHDNFVSPEEDDEHHAQQFSEYGVNRSSQSGHDMDRKRRKRVFSNRTKTGCMTCRRRKKKCDEQHPECNNCLRGGFVCEGYTMRNTWQKPANVKAPIPLQSKHGYPVPIHRPPYHPSRYSSEVSPEYPGPPQPGPNQHPASDGDRVKPILLDEDHNLHSISSPPSVHPKPTWSKTTRPYPSNPPHISKYQPEGDHRSGSIHELSYEHQDQSSMHPPSSNHRASSSQSQYSMPSSQTANQTANQNNAQAVAQTALQQTTSLRPSPHRRSEQLTEREKMLKGAYYYPFSPALIEDRERCIAAIWRFNNATNPSHGASPEERARLFRAILSIRPTPEQMPPANSADGLPAPSMSLPFGSVGERVVVEAPFHCDYGYNITIGDDVLIGADCRISDTCAVTIGARCIFSPNVKLVCATYPIDPRRRMGSGGPALGRNIVIEEDCWIGTNVTILAGVRVGKSSTVGAGSLLHQDVPRFTVVAGNPAKVSRGIYDGQADGS